MTKLYLFLPLLIFPNIVFSQTDIEKGLEKVKNAKDYKQEVEVLIGYSELWFGENMDSAKYYAKKA